MDVPFRIDIFSILIFLGTVQGVFLAVLLFLKRKDSFYPTTYLSLLLLMNAFFLTELFLSYSGYIVYVLHLVDFSEPANFIYGPLLYLYIRSFLGTAKKKHDWIHFVPFIFYLGYAVFFYMQSWDYKYNAYIHSHHPELPYIDAPAFYHEDPLGIKGYVNELSILLTGVYSYLALKVVWISRGSTLKGIFSFTNEREKWIFSLLSIQIFSYLNWVYRTVFSYRDLDDYLAATFTSIVIYYVSYILFLKPDVLKNSSKQEKYSKSKLTEASRKRIVAQLDELMKEQQVFKKNTLSLAMLSEQISVSSHSISQALNEELHINFFDYIGLHRVEEAKKILVATDSAHLAIEDIAEQVGYNSKSAFYKAFKKHSGCTPAEFRKQQL